MPHRIFPATFIMEADKPWREQEPIQLPPLGEGRFAVWSWSPDGQWLAGDGYFGARGIYVYSVELGNYEKVTDTGAGPRWLSDSRTLVYNDAGSIRAVDRDSKDDWEVAQRADHMPADRRPVAASDGVSRAAASRGRQDASSRAAAKSLVACNR